MLRQSSPLARRLLSTSASSSSTTSTTHFSTTHFGSKTVPMSSKADLVGEVFSSVAGNYDVMNDVMSAGVHRLWKDYFVSDVMRVGETTSYLSQNPPTPTSPPIPYFRHLDVAGGTGDISFRSLDSINLSLSHPPHTPPTPGIPCPATVTVCDINPDMLRVGESRAVELYSSHNVEKMSDRTSEDGLSSSKPLSFWEGDAQSLPFEDDTFDIYSICFGLRNVTEPDKAIEDAYRILKPGGRLLIMEFSHPKNDAIAAAYDAYSFNVIPEMGERIAGDRDSYQYLVESIRKFYKQEELVDVMKEKGFVEVGYEELNFGVVAIHSGWKI
ncbi:hypothetical protein TrLO_g5245 [Triparma laevis f. longispina]|uniref:2-methoxy-6-polyprenyl-1,4-benzoquinol methylase, mitochondrial n=1 Tax=Triparma laevis f. longispina TaxID=1714387 RepID=A0A9W7E409_9STRA|nr:hypothetical protein TrLO_g5245 [Triparma laevis f. longispina]